MSFWTAGADVTEGSTSSCGLGLASGQRQDEMSGQRRKLFVSWQKNIQKIQAEAIVFCHSISLPQQLFSGSREF